MDCLSGEIDVMDNLRMVVIMCHRDVLCSECRNERKSAI